MDSTQFDQKINGVFPFSIYITFGSEPGQVVKHPWLNGSTVSDYWTWTAGGFIGGYMPIKTFHVRKYGCTEYWGDAYPAYMTIYISGGNSNSFPVYFNLIDDTGAINISECFEPGKQFEYNDILYRASVTIPFKEHVILFEAWGGLLEPTDPSYLYPLKEPINPWYPKYKGPLDGPSKDELFRILHKVKKNTWILPPHGTVFTPGQKVFIKVLPSECYKLTKFKVDSAELFPPNNSWEGIGPRHDIQVEGIAEKILTEAELPKKVYAVILPEGSLKDGADTQAIRDNSFLLGSSFRSSACELGKIACDPNPLWSLIDAPANIVIDSATGIISGSLDPDARPDNDDKEEENKEFYIKVVDRSGEGTMTVSMTIAKIPYSGRTFTAVTPLPTTTKVTSMMLHVDGSLWVGGGNTTGGVIYKTSDKGVSWVLVNQFTSGTLAHVSNMVQMGNGNVVVSIVRVDGSAYISTLVSSTWTDTAGLVCPTGRMIKLSATEVLATCSRSGAGYFCRSIDSGVNWSSVFGAGFYYAPTLAGGFNHLLQVEGDIILFTFKDYGAGNYEIFRSTDKGATATSVKAGSITGNYFQNIDSLITDKGVIVFSLEKEIWVSLDKGLTFSKRATLDNNLMAIGHLGEEGVEVGLASKLASRSRTAGSTWTTVTTPVIFDGTPQRIYSEALKKVWLGTDGTTNNLYLSEV